jgi:serine/threonine-protein kinase RsbW
MCQKWRAKPSFELHQSFASHVDGIEPFIDQLMKFIKRFTGNFKGGTDAEDAIEAALHEALANAVIHGNHKDPGKQVDVSCHCSMDGEVSITIRDQGEGFDVDAVPDPTDPETRLLSFGRGLYLIRSLMDEVTFEDGGTVLRMQKRIA